MKRLAALLALIFALASPVRADPPSMNKADWASDLDFLYAQMKATHPALHHRTGAVEMDAAVASLHKAMPGATWPEYVMGLYRILALVGDGHTTFFPMPDAGPGFDTRYPLITEAFADGLYVIGADAPYGDAVSGRVVAIAGHPVREVFDTLAQYWDHENEMWVLRWLPFVLRRPGYLHGTHIASGGINDALTLTIEKADKRHDIAVKPIPVAEDTRRMAKGYVRADVKGSGPTPLHGKDVPFDFVHLKERNAVYAVYNQSDDGDKETVAAFAGRLFAYIDANKVDRLVIDVRANGGGDNYKNQPLLLGMIKARAIDRPGHLFILTGRKTFSAAQNFVNQAERWTQAIFVGEPTGSSPNLWGDAKQMELPRTHLHPMVSTLYWEDSDPTDKRVWVLPGVPVQASFADYLAGRDPVLEAALAFTAEPQPVPPNTHWYREGQKRGWTIVL